MTQIADGIIDCSEGTLGTLRGLKEDERVAQSNPYFDYLTVHVQAPRAQITNKFCSKIILQAVKDGDFEAFEKTDQGVTQDTAKPQLRSLPPRPS